jgi:ATP-dependent metalloprotease FtsH
VITTVDGRRKWLDLGTHCTGSQLFDYFSGVRAGSIHRVCDYDHSLNKFGPDQMAKEIFGALEQRVTEREKHMFHDNAAWLDSRFVKYDAPGCLKLHLSWDWTPPQYKMAPYLKTTPKIAFWCFTYSFIGIVIAISIFAKPKKPPMDLQGAIEFAYSKADARKDGKVKVRFNEIAGIENVIEQLKEVVMLLRQPEYYTDKPLQAQPPKGILLEGQPGTGKTLIAKAIACEAGIAFYQMSGSEFIQAIVGVGAARVRDLFRRARVNRPCVVFIDEIDAFGAARVESGAEAMEEHEQTLNQLLTEMDGFSPNESVILIAASNRSDLLDPALLRAGRFDRKIKINKPDFKGREKILEVHAKKIRLGPNVNLTRVARETPGLSPAELANVLNEAGLEAIKRMSHTRVNLRKNEFILNNDLNIALDRTRYGTKGSPTPNTSWLKDLHAGCEAAKSLVASILRSTAGRVEKIVHFSIVPRGRGDTFTDFARFYDDDYLVQTRGKILDRTRVLFAARAAEEFLFKNASYHSVANIDISIRKMRQLVYPFALSDSGVLFYVPSTNNGLEQKSASTNVDNLEYDSTLTQSSHELRPTVALLNKLNAALLILNNEIFTDACFILQLNGKALSSTAKFVKENNAVST